MLIGVLVITRLTLQFLPKHLLSAFYCFMNLGIFLGLNGEYEESGRTELEHAPQIDDPWSPSITFHPQRHELKVG